MKKQRYLRIDTQRFTQPGRALVVRAENAHKVEIVNNPFANPIFLGEAQIAPGTSLVLESLTGLTFFEDLKVSSGGITDFSVVIYSIQER